MYGLCSFVLKRNFFLFYAIGLCYVKLTYSLGTFGAVCSTTKPCNAGLNLRCEAISAQRPTCTCLAGGYIRNGDGCYRVGADGFLGQKCNQLQICKIANNLSCTKSGVCNCTTGSVVHNKDKCGPPSKYDQPCPPPCDHVMNLECVNNKCVCAAGYTPTVYQDCIAMQYVKLSESCDPYTGIDCEPQSNLECSNAVCQCTLGKVPHAGGKCGPGAMHGQQCGPPECDTSLHLMCVAQRCVCEDQEQTVQNGACIPPALFGELCNPLPCSTALNLQCSHGRCTCSPGYRQASNGCSLPPPAGYGEACDELGISQPKCDVSQHLRCEPKIGKCLCDLLDGYYSIGNKECAKRSKFKELCHAKIPCESGPTWNLQCVNRKCECIPKHVENEQLKCSLPATYGEKCDLPSCQQNLNLICKNKKCECQRKNDIPQPNGGCLPQKDSFYGDPCDPAYGMTCKSSGNMACSSTGVCVCVNDTYIPQPNGTCQFPQPALFGSPCDLTKGWMCLRNSNLTCSNGTCSCLNQIDYESTAQGQCTPLAKYMENCGPPSCNTGHNLECQNRKCRCTKGNVRYSDDICRLPPVSFGGNCDNSGIYNLLCDIDKHLICDTVSNICVCNQALGYSSIGNNTCGKTSKFKELCNANLTCEAGSSWNLQCSNGRCACLSGYVENQGLKCSLPAKLGENCDLPSCRENSHLTCKNKKCECTRQTDIPQANGGCIPQINVFYGGPCDPTQGMICETSGNLVCSKNGLCSCSSDTYLPTSNGTCQIPPPAPFGGSCDLVKGWICLPSANLACASGKCTCLNQIDYESNAQGGCSPLAKLGGNCGPPTCYQGVDWGLQCTNKSCMCSTGYVPYKDGKCALPGKHGEVCNPPTCNSIFNLTCVLNKCDCVSGHELVGNESCVPIAQYGEKCGPPSCYSGYNLDCIKNECDCKQGYIAYSDKICRLPPSSFEGPCDYSGIRNQMCNNTEHLICHNVSKTCVCDHTSNYYSLGNKECGQTAKLNQLCDSKLPCESGPSWNLQCSHIACTCTLGHVENEGLKCSLPAKHGEKCDLPSCQQNGFLVCKNKACACEGPSYYPQPSGVCDREVEVMYGGLCNLSQGLICKAGANLECNSSGLCQCNSSGNSSGSASVILPQPDGTCQIPAPAPFGQPCDLTKGWLCLNNSNLTCVNSSCECLNSDDYEPNVNGTCNLLKKLGETCGPPNCYEGPQWNLQCRKNVCECINGTYAAQNGSCELPSVYGQTCPPQCDPLKNLICLNGQCTCKDNFEVNQLKNCQEFKKLDESCNPSKCYPGPAWNLQCVNNTCTCVPGMLPYPNGRCGLFFANYSEPCSDPNDPNSIPPYQLCDVHNNQECSNITRTCLCMPQLGYLGNETCGKDARLYQLCNEVPCRTPQNYYNLQCISDVCQCAFGFVEDEDFRCSKPALGGQKCDLPSCDTTANLTCVNSSCVCLPGYFPQRNPVCSGLQFVGYGDQCIAAYGWYCRRNGNLTCSKTICTCSDAKMTPLHSGNCDFRHRVEYFDYCNPLDDWYCNEKSNLACVNSSCLCSSPNYIPLTDGKCGLPPPGTYHEICDMSKNWICTASQQLKCINGICDCLTSDYLWARDRKSCFLKDGAELSQGCDLTKGWKCWKDLNLQCSRDDAAGVCVCTNTTTPAVGRRSCVFPDPAALGEPCDIDKGWLCRENSHLDCTTSGFCNCTDKSMEADGHGGCVYKTQGSYGKLCDLDQDCIPEFKLKCKGKRCRCMEFHERDSILTHMCTPAMNDLHGHCTADEHCLPQRNLFCDLQTEVCACVKPFEPDNSTNPQCTHTSLHDGRVMGEPCHDFPGQQCSLNYYLMCQGVCICRHGYVPDDSTIPAHNKILGCKAGTGTQGRGQACFSQSESLLMSYECDSHKSLTCEQGHLICVCAPGYFPSQNNTCASGKQHFGEPCDPEDLIIPQRPVDPVTGLAVPGPVSPAPSLLACDPEYRLVCVNGKCRCPDDVVSKRYKLEPVTQKCLVANGYNCNDNDDCLSGKCLSDGEENDRKSKRFHHTHRGKKCCCVNEDLIKIGSGEQLVTFEVKLIIIMGFVQFPLINNIFQR